MNALASGEHSGLGSDRKPPSPGQVNRSRWLLLGLLAFFLLPALLANLAFRLGWLDGGQTNYGQLVPAGTRIALTAETWQLVILPAERLGRCHTDCEQAALLAEQVKLTLGRESHRVSVLVAQALTEADWAALQQTRQQLFIVDPQGHVALGYPVLAEREAMLQISRGLQKDLKRLLKYSRAGQG